MDDQQQGFLDFTDPPPTGDQLKAQGMALVLSRTPSQVYRDHLIAALQSFPTGARITVEDLTEIVGRPEKYGASYNCVGAIIHGMATKGLISKTGRMVKPARPERHSADIPEWEVLPETLLTGELRR